MKHYISTLAAVALLAACGGGGGGQAGTVDPNAAANAASNAFLASVLEIVNNTSETGEPVNTDSIALGTSETLEPSPL
jgi:branched-subunit amino acid ABC-type transport system permease component